MQARPSILAVPLFFALVAGCSASDEGAGPAQGSGGFQASGAGGSPAAGAAGSPAAGAGGDLQAAGAGGDTQSAGAAGEGGAGGEGGAQGGAAGSGGEGGLAGGAGGAAGEASAGTGGQAPGGEVSFERKTVDAKAMGAAWVTAADVDGDGKLDLVASNFGALGFGGVPPGEIKLYRRGEDLSSWTGEDVVPSSSGIKFMNGTTVTDVDGDGDQDIVATAGFLVCTAIPGGQPCSGLFWMENQGPGKWAPHIIVPGNYELFYHHAEVVDLDGDGLRDLVTVGESQQTDLFGQAKKRAQAEWYKGTADADRFEKKARIIGQGLGSIPSVMDIDGDGDLDVASAEYFVDKGSFAWFERLEGEAFVRHVIDDTSGPSIMLRFIPDLYGDGVTRAVGSNHTNTAKFPPDAQDSAIFVLDRPSDPKQPWAKTQISQGIKSAPGSLFAPQAAPGVFGHGDIDGDGDVDLLVSGDGDPRVFWLEQKGPGQWATHVLEQNLPQAGGMVVVDLDGDGKNELVVTGYEANAIYIYTRK